MNENILNHISGKYHTAIITSFNFDIAYFDSKILPKLEMNNTKNIILFIDQKEFEKSIERINNSYIGKKYHVVPFKMNSSFHPKLFLMLGDDIAKLIIGSINQTHKGYMSNQEIFNVYEYDKNENIKNLSIIQKAVEFIKKLIEKCETKDEIVYLLNNLYYLDFKSDQEDTYFLDSYDEPILNQVQAIIDEPIKKIDIAVPFYDDKLLAYKQIEEQLNCLNIKLYVQNEKSTFPVEYNVDNDIAKNIFIFGKIVCNESENFYHGKVIRFITDNNSYILFGSSNCTLAALCKSYKTGGNLECNILSKGDINEFDQFFNQFELSEKKEFKQIIEEPRVNTHKTISIDKVEVINKSVEIIVKTDIIPKKVYINEVEVEYKFEDKKIYLTISKDLVDTVFDIKIIADSEYNLKGFYNDISRIEDFRHSEKKQFRIPEHLLNKDNMMLSDLVEIITCLPTEKEQIEEQREVAKSYKLKKNENESDDLTEEYEIDNEKLLEYAKKYNDSMKIKRIASHVSDSYFWSLLNEKLSLGEDKEILHHGSGSSSNGNNSSLLTEIDVEQYNDNQCKKLITKLVDKVTIDSFVDILDYKSYKDYVGLVLSYLDKYQKTFNNKQLLSYDDILKYKYLILSKLLKKEYNNELNEEEEKAIIVSVFITLLEMNVYNNDDNNNNKDRNIEPKTKSLLKELSKYESLKKYDDELTKAIEILNIRKINIGFNNAKKLIDDNIGYLNFKNIKYAIEDLISGNKKIMFNNNVVICIIETDQIVKCLEFKNSPKMDKVIKLMKYYSNDVEQIKEFNILITSTVESSIIKMEYMNNITTLKAKRKTYYSNGLVNDIEPEYDIKYFR